MALQPLPPILRYNDKIEFEEDGQSEFKALQNTKKLIEIIAKYCREYLNAFINTRGGHLWLGIEDDGSVKGLMISRHDKDSIRLVVDASVNQMVPQIDAEMHRTVFIPVENGPPPDATKKDAQRYVIVASILSGGAPLYFTSFNHQSAYVRRDGSIVKLSADGVVRRLTMGRQTHLTTDDYDSSTFHDSREKYDSNLFNYYLEHQCVGFIGRRELLNDSITFLRADVQQCTKVLLFSGQESVGKTWLAEYLRQIIYADKKQFPASYEVYYMDLKGSADKTISLKDVLIGLIRSVDPSIDLSFASSIHSSRGTKLIPSIPDNSSLICDNTGEVTILSSDNSTKNINSIRENARNMSNSGDQSIFYVQSSIFQNSGDSRNTNLAPGINDARILEKKKSASCSFLQDLLPKSIVSEATTIEPVITTLRNIYINALLRINEKGKDIVLHLENADDWSCLESLIPAGVRSIVLITCRRYPQIDISGPTIKYKSLHVPPLSDTEGGYIAMILFPQLNATEAQELSRLCNGLPKIIKLICQRSLEFSIPPSELLNRLKMTTKEDRLQSFTPLLYNILTSLPPELRIILARLSIFPSIFTEDAALYIIAIDDLDLQSKRSDYLALLRKLVTQLFLEVSTDTGLSSMPGSWWKLYTPVREYVHGWLPSPMIRGLVNRFLTYILNLYKQLKERLIIQKAKDKGLSVKDYLTKVDCTSNSSSKETPIKNSIKIHTQQQKAKPICLKISLHTPKATNPNEIATVSINQVSSQSRSEEFNLIYENFDVWQPCLEVALQLCHAYCTSNDRDLYDEGALYGFHLIDCIIGFEGRLRTNLEAIHRAMTDVLQKQPPSGIMENIDTLLSIWDHVV